MKKFALNGLDFLVRLGVAGCIFFGTAEHLYSQTRSPAERMAPLEERGSQAAEADPKKLPAPHEIRRPQPGDKLGYSKEESTRILDPEVRQLFDAFLRLYREPGLFANRRATMEALGVSDYERTWDRTGHREPEEPMSYVDRFAREGLFARPGWSGQYAYSGWRGVRHQSWEAALTVAIDRDIACIDSRAVEGYLDLFLETGLDGRPHPIPAAYWNRHGAFGSPYALAAGPKTPGLSMWFESGCLAKIWTVKIFPFKEIGDENARN